MAIGDVGSSTSLFVGFSAQNMGAASSGAAASEVTGDSLILNTVSPFAADADSAEALQCSVKRFASPRLVAGGAFVATTLVGSGALAYGGPVPEFQSGEHVYFVPPALREKFGREHDLTLLSERLFNGELKHSDYVVIFESVGGAVRRSEETVDATDDVWKAWAGKNGFDPATASVVALSLREHGIATHPGEQWKEGLGFIRDRIANFQNREFIPYAKQGRLVPGMVAYLKALDRFYNDEVGTRQRDLRGLIEQGQSLLKWNEAAIKDLEDGEALSFSRTLDEAGKAAGTDRLSLMKEGGRLLQEGMVRLNEDLARVGQSRQGLQKTIETAQALLQNADLPADADVGVLRAAVEKAKAELTSGKPNSFKMATIDLQSAMNPLQTAIAARQEAKKLSEALSLTIGEAEQFISHPPQLPQGKSLDLRFLGEALKRAKLVLGSGNMEAQGAAVFTDLRLTLSEAQSELARIQAAEEARIAAEHVKTLQLLFAALMALLSVSAVVAFRYSGFTDRKRRTGKYLEGLEKKLLAAQRQLAEMFGQYEERDGISQAFVQGRITSSFFDELEPLIFRLHFGVSASVFD